mmetsp:Transcript_13922/g.20821  ORF Transcript_13922/g.20821 Transcript_13922/m.20821 type:complete len:274 (+) Transcript_13922:102-923(+)|eukprot:CAMPEP_0185026168 /NCGR_PEP_ID=MMETSP1103-20130426/10131_1 /TAXON_ID=36769 /ORGANISM="Paraphysomonas bandaiensis, Strain Caron Lab Isolate" /LENGTH=273 /DNA_ID=CAMNT_0027559661 /DNA_START=36 /DNA_END=857 /DNA_ORIENTATION=-
MSHFHDTHINDPSRAASIPDHLLAKNQQATPENIALFKSAKAGSMTGVLNAIDKGAKPDFFYNPEDSKNALHVAAEEGYTDIVRELLKDGACVDCIVLGSKDTALHLATRNQHTEVVKILIDAGASCTAVNGYGNSALHEAIREDCEEISELLLAQGCDVNLPNHKGSTPFHFLCYHEQATPGHLEFARKLVKHGADIHARDGRGMTPFLVCCSSGREDLIDLLLEEGADPTVRDGSGRSAHDIAEFHRHPHIMQRFTDESPVHRFHTAFDRK